MTATADQSENGSGARSEKKVCLVLFLAFWLTYSFFFQGGGWNQNVRFDLIRAIVEDGRLSINPYVEKTPNTGDLAIYKGHYHPNKPPGISFLGAPVYAVLFYGEILLGMEPLGSLSALHWNAHLVCAMTVSLLSAVLCVFLFTALKFLRPAPVRERLFITIGYGLGTLAFPWSTMLHAQQVSAALTFIAFALLLKQEYGPDVAGRASESTGCRCCNVDLVAGLLCGFSILVEYNNLVAATLLAGFRLLGPRPGFGLKRFAVGAAIPLAALMLYQWSCFENPFVSNYRYQNLDFQNEAGAVFQLPSPKALLDLTILPYRGLFFSAPFLLLAIPGMVWFHRQIYGRLPEALLCLALVVFYLVLNASFIKYHGGWTVGPRYLVPCLPFLAAAAHFYRPWNKLLAWLLLLISIFFQTALTVVHPAPPDASRNPLLNHTLYLYSRNRISVNTQSMLDKWPSEKIGQPIPAGAEWNSFNLGEAMGLEGVLSLLPLVILWGSVFFYLRRRGETNESLDC